MTANTTFPADRASFDAAITDVLADHAVLRHLAAETSRSGFAADDAISLADAMISHEITEARLFALPFVTSPPKTVTSTAARARRRCIEYTSGDFRLPTPNAAAALFVEALLAHLAAEDAWLAHESEHQHERMLESIA
jgi:hypothetical protein